MVVRSYDSDCQADGAEVGACLLGVGEEERRHTDGMSAGDVGRRVVEEHRLAGLHFVAIADEPVDGGVGFGDADLARQDDVVELLEHVVALPAPRERLGGEVRQPEHAYAKRSEVGDQIRSSLDLAENRLDPTVAPGLQRCLVCRMTFDELADTRSRLTRPSS